jgi:hypothetical protein
MLFTLVYHWRSSATDEDTRKLRTRFVAWNPPPGLDLLAHYHYARGGGIVILESSSGAAIFEGLAPFVPILDIDLEPVVNVIEAVAISMGVEEWTDSVDDGSPKEQEG